MKEMRTFGQKTSYEENRPFKMRLEYNFIMLRKLGFKELDNFLLATCD